MHSPSQAVAQQTPSSQKPEAHSVPAPQGAPGPSTSGASQFPATQVRPTGHSSSVTGLVAQDVGQSALTPSHAYVPHTPSPALRAG